MTLDQTIVDELFTALGEEKISVEVEDREKVAADRYELSPILREDLPITLPDVVVSPLDEDDVSRTLQIAFRHGIAVTPRGAGTGNYGQAVSFERGIMMDFSKMRGIKDLGEGYMRVAAGTKIFQMERAARKTGQELALIPSTVGSTIGGFLGGGSGGAGSIQHGWIWDGFAQEVTVVPCDEDSQPFVAKGAEARPYLHSYGTTGFITEAVITLVPAQERVGIYASLDTIESAAAVGEKIMALPVPPRLLSVDSPEVAEILAATNEHIRPGAVNMRILIDESQQDAVRAQIEAGGGTVDAVVEGSDAIMLSTAFNHVTERVLDSVSGYCHLQVSGGGIGTAARDLDGKIPGLWCHLDGFNLMNRPAFVGIFFHPFNSRDDIENAKELLATVDVRVNDPHKWGIQKNVEVYRPVAATNDVKGLLNPGKLP